MGILLQVETDQMLSLGTESDYQLPFVFYPIVSSPIVLDCVLNKGRSTENVSHLEPFVTEI
jgi:hypothetical protein